MTKPTEYEWIRRWGRAMGSYDYYIVEQQKQAAADGAPLDSIFWRDVEQYDRDLNAQGQGHASDCAVHNEPAMPAGPCDCGFDRGGEVVGKRVWLRVRDIESVMTLSRFVNMYPETRDELEPLIIKLSEPLSEEAEADLS